MAQKQIMIILADAQKNSECQWNISWEKMFITWPNCSFQLWCLRNDTKWWRITAEPTQITFNGPKANHGCPYHTWECPQKLWMSLRCLTGQDFMDICCQVLLIVLCFFVISSEKHLYKYVNLCKFYIIFQCQGHWMLSKLVQQLFVIILYLSVSIIIGGKNDVSSILGFLNPPI